MAIRERLIEKIKSLPEDSLKEVAALLAFLEMKKRPEPMLEGPGVEGTDPLAKVIGICEGPSDLAERHNEYIYGIK